MKNSQINPIEIITDKKDYLFSKYNVSKMAFFGSSVRDELREDSDVDILVELKEPTFRHFIGLARELEDILQRKVELITFDSLDKYLRPKIIGEMKYIERS